MSSVFVASLWAWVALVAIVLFLALYRLMITRGLYTVLHVRRSELSLVPDQIVNDHRLQRIDFWGQMLTVAAVLLGLLLGLVYLHMAVGPVTWPDPYPAC